ncbi:MAG: FHA domain-containing protein [Spongiibacteraceae bacterium]|nr:FHA domain-containing protein [Spongiibacteraceae bacterium]
MTSSVQVPSEILLNSMSGKNSIELQGEVIFGRGSMCDVILEDDRLSRKHAKLSAGDGGLMLEDLGSTNGTFVNDKKIDSATWVKHGDVIRFDHLVYQVSVVGGLEEPPVVAIADEPPVPMEEVVESRTQVFCPPKSWALDEKVPADGTQVMSLAMLQQLPDEELGLSVAEEIDEDCPVLMGLSGEVEGKLFKFNTRDKLTKWEIGRDDNCDILIDASSVSYNHAQLIHEGRRWKLIDLMSANGTYVNGNKGLTSYLSSGDTVRFGQVEFVFKLGEESWANKRKRNKKKGNGGFISALYPWILCAFAFAGAGALLYYFLF